MPLSIPPSLQSSLVTSGKTAKYIRALFYGGYKTGKSTALASFPKPILTASGGDEQGIAQMLNPAEGDMCFDIDTPDRLMAFTEFGIKNMDTFKSLLFDPMTPLWEDYMQHWNEKFGGDIKGPQWNQVKSPWKLFMRQLKRSRLHVGMSAWLKDILYENVEVAPGVSKLTVSNQEVAQIEKKIPYHVDLIFQTAVQLDKKRRPTPIHEVIFVGGRRPRTIPPSELYAGKKWLFDSRTDTSVWNTVIQPWLDKYDEATGVDFLGPMDPVAEREDDREAETLAADAMGGGMLRAMEGAQTLQEYRDVVWATKISPYLESLEPAVKATILRRHEERKKELSK